MFIITYFMVMQFDRDLCLFHFHLLFGYLTTSFVYFITSSIFSYLHKINLLHQKDPYLDYYHLLKRFFAILSPNINIPRKINANQHKNIFSENKQKKIFFHLIFYYFINLFYRYITYICYLLF